MSERKTWVERICFRNAIQTVGHTDSDLWMIDERQDYCKNPVRKWYRFWVTAKDDLIVLGPKLKKCRGGFFIVGDMVLYTGKLLGAVTFHWVYEDRGKLWLLFETDIREKIPIPWPSASILSIMNCRMLKLPNRSIVSRCVKQSDDQAHHCFEK